MPIILKGVPILFTPLHRVSVLVEFVIDLPFGQRPLVRQNGFLAALGKAQASLALRSLVLTEPSPSGVTERNRAKSPNKNNPNYRKISIQITEYE